MVYSLKGIQKLLRDIEERQEKQRQKAYNRKVGYAPKCTVCTDPRLDEIEKLREDGYTLQDIKDELELNCSIMALSRHFKNHYPKSQEYKQKQQIQMLENIQEAYIKYPFLEEYFKDKELKYLEEFNTQSGFCTDDFTLCNLIPAGTVSNSNKNVLHLYDERNEKIENLKDGWYYDKDRENKIKLEYMDGIFFCLNCKNQIQEKRLNLLEKIITYNFLNIAPESKELYFNLLNFNGTPEEFIQTLEEGKEINQEGK